MHLGHYDLTHIALPRMLQKPPPKTHILFGVQKFIQKIISGTKWFEKVWPILSCQGSYVNVHLTLRYFLVLKTYWKIALGTLWFDRYFPYQRLYQVFIKGACFFLFQMSLRNLNHIQYGLTKSICRKLRSR